jgi:hypothetical protein
MGIVNGTKVTLDELRAIAENSKESLVSAAASMGRDVILYLHWSAGHYHQHYDDYHISIDNDGSVVVTTDDLSTVLPHTWHRNTGAVGITLACGANADSNDLGKEPPTDAQIEAMAQVIAVLTSVFTVTIDPQHVMTHAEAANIDGYGPDQTWERWDLWFLKNGDEPGTGGSILRGKGNFYRNQEAK